MLFHKKGKRAEQSVLLGSASREQSDKAIRVARNPPRGHKKNIRWNLSRGTLISQVRPTNLRNRGNTSPGGWGDLHGLKPIK